MENNRESLAAMEISQGYRALVTMLQIINL